MCAPYGKETYSSVDKLRYKKVRLNFKGRKGILSGSNGVVLSQMPPFYEVLHLHISTNFQTLVWGNSHVQLFYLPDPPENGRVVSPSGGLVIQWFFTTFLPRDIFVRS